MMDDAHTLLEDLMAWLATVGDVRLLGTADAVADLMAATAGPADVVLIDLPRAGREESLDAVGQLVSAGYRVIVISVLAAAGNTNAAPLPPIGAGVRRPHLAPQERAVLLAYASGMTLAAAARHVGIRPNTAKVYLERVKEKYRHAGRPTYTKLDLATRVREDRL